MNDSKNKGHQVVRSVAKKTKQDKGRERTEVLLQKA